MVTSACTGLLRGFWTNAPFNTCAAQPADAITFTSLLAAETMLPSIPTSTAKRQRSSEGDAHDSSLLRAASTVRRSALRKRSCSSGGGCGCGAGGATTGACGGSGGVGG